MINLNEYLGSIASSLAEARLASDLKSLEVAEQFAKHDLLKHFSIPRFRMQNVELTIPVAIGEIGNDATNFSSIDNKVAFGEKTITILKKVAPTSTKPVNELELKLKSAIEKEIILLEKNVNLGLDAYKEVHNYAERVVTLYYKMYPAITSRIARGAVINNVREGLKTYVKSKPKSNEKFTPKVIVEGHKLRELPAENVIQIKMTLNEESMEWHTSEDENGKVQSKLLAE